jgi:MscS family membrane protein
MGKTQWSGMSKQQFDEIITNPLERIIMVLVIVFSIGTLNFPNAFKFTIYHTTSENIVSAFVSAIVIITCVSLVLRFLDFLMKVIKYKTGDQPASEHQLLYFFKDLIRVVIIIFAFIFILKFSFKINIGNLLTGLSIVGAALALSARESLENLIASFVIFFDKPFKTGDTVKIKEFSGSVERIGLRSTRIRTLEKSLITVPNKQMVDNILDNWSERNLVRNELKTVLSSQTDAAELEKVVTEIRDIFSKKQRVVSSMVYLQEITNDNALIMAIYFTNLHMPIEELNGLRQSLNIEIKKMLTANEVKTATTQRVTLHTDTK